ncbi:MAG: TRAM domain-containing protein, partial [Desulfarculus sp.]|nr:TRAM domain-containing protein [Desulfarculus sp.]
MPKRPQRRPQVPAPEEEVVRVELHDQAVGGSGLGRLADGRVVFVRGGLAGETVRAGILRRRKDYAEAELQEVLTPSPQRVEPACPVYGRCGGCDLMQLDYAAQVEAKAGWVVRALRRLEGLPQAQVLASPRQWGYRNRVRMQLKQGVPGFFARQSHQLVPVKSCPAAAAEINRIIPELSTALAEPPWSDCRWVEILAGDEGPAFLTLDWPWEEPPADLDEVASALGAAGIRLAGPEGLEPWPLRPETGLIYHEGDGLALRAFPGHFSQVNWAGNALLIQTVREAAAGSEPGAALDLYAGGGNFSLPLMSAGWRVTAVEGQEEAAQACFVQAGWAGLAERLQVRAQAADLALG